MFRIFLTAGRSAQLRSPTLLRYNRLVTPRTSTRQQSSTAGKPIDHQTQSPKAASITTPAEALPSPQPPSAAKDAIGSETQHGRNPPNHDDRTAEDTAYPPKPINGSATESAQDLRNAQEMDSATPVKRRMGRPPKPVEPKGPPKKRGPKPKPKPEKPPPKKRDPKPKPKVEEIPKPRGCPPGSASSAPTTKRRRGKVRLELTENVSADVKTITLSKIESASKRSKFVSENIRADFLPYLAWARGHSQGRSIGDNNRINIVSESLCDDTMTRLEPSLQKHIGCDIIEVNPGIGLWSERLHNFLRPRTHILLEPDNCMYQPILQPLLDAPGSTYQLIPKSGLVWGHLEKVFTKEYLPHQEPLSRGDPRLEERNDTLLFVANLGRYPRKGYRGFSSIANLVLYQLMSAVRNHSLFQRYGHVRMLIWIANDERDTLLPQTVSLRRKSAIEAEISCEKIQEIASSAGSGEIFPREPALEFERTRLVYEKMKQAGITIPIGRESSILKEIMTGKVRGEQDEFTPKFAEELEELEARYANGELGDWGEEFHDAAFRGLQRMPRKGESPQLNRLKTLRYHFKSRKQKFDKLHDLKCEYNGVFAMQQEVYKTRDPKERQALEEVLKKRTDDWQKGANNITPSERETLFAQLDNIRIFETDPPTLMWDRRDFEPLKVHPAEFRPQREMCLLDIQPKPLWPILQEDFPVNFDVLEFIITQLFIIPTQSIRRGLSALAPGAYDYLIAECPSLTDPTKGGSLDVDQMSVRRLTQDMLKEITEAWVRWPFKPTRFEIMSQLGSTIYDPDALETDMTED